MLAVVIVAILVGSIFVGCFLVGRTTFEGCDIVLIGGVDFFDPVFGKVFGKRFAAVIFGVVLFAGRNALIFLFGTEALFFLGGFGFFSQQRVAIGLGNLVVIGMDFAEREEAMAIAAKVDKSRLQRRFDPCYFSEVDIAFDLLVFGRFEIEFLNPVALQNRHPGFFRVARIDKHARCH